MRTYFADFFNTIINDPAIRHQFGYTGYLDVTGLLLNTNNYALANDEGGFMFLARPGAVYEVHTMFPPTANPLKTVRFMKKAVEYMFTQTPCETIVTQVPDDNKAASKLCDMMGFHEDMHEDNAWKPGVGISYRSLILDRWARGCSTGQEAGKAFPRSAEDPAISANEGASSCR